MGFSYRENLRKVNQRVKICGGGDDCIGASALAEQSVQVLIFSKGNIATPWSRQVCLDPLKLRAVGVCWTGEHVVPGRMPDSWGLAREVLVQVGGTVVVDELDVVVGGIVVVVLLEELVVVGGIVVELLDDELVVVGVIVVVDELLELEDELVVVLVDKVVVVVETIVVDT